MKIGTGLALSAMWISTAVVAVLVSDSMVLIAAIIGTALVMAVD